MKFFLSFILTAALAYFICLYFPWWNMPIVAFIIAVVIKQSPGKSFLTGFSSIFILWAVLAFIIDQKNESILSKKIAQILPLGGSTILLILVTTFVGGLVAGFAALSGSLLNQSKKSKGKNKV